MIDTPTAAASAPEPTHSYNYDAFDFAFEQAEFARWLSTGPRIGEPAPEFELMDLDGNAVRLSDLRGKPVVLEFGSYTCPIFSDRIPEMERLAREHLEATFLVIYVREAHPGEHQEPHHSLSEKRSAAHKLALEEALARRVLVDSLDGSTHRAYGGAWNPVYVIGRDGRVVMRQAWTHPRDVATALEAMHDGIEPAIAESTEMLRAPGRRPTGARLLERGGVRALEDFYRSAPGPVRDSLRNSESTEVRSAIAGFEGAEVLIFRSKDGTPIAL
jgi:Iodothyronine deiodinase